MPNGTTIGFAGRNGKASVKREAQNIHSTYTRSEEHERWSFGR